MEEAAWNKLRLQSPENTYLIHYLQRIGGGGILPRPHYRLLRLSTYASVMQGLNSPGSTGSQIRHLAPSWVLSMGIRHLSWEIRYLKIETRPAPSTSWKFINISVLEYIYDLERSSTLV